MFTRLLMVLLVCGGLCPAEEIAVKGGTIDFQVAGKGPVPDRAILKRWVENSAHAVSLYYGGSFPVAKATVRATLSAGREPKSGQAFGDHGYLITLDLGRSVTEPSLKRDWVLTHEMFHLGLPALAAKHHWLEE